MVTHQVVAYLVALAVGYWVLTLAGKEKGKNQLTGQVIGWAIIIVAAGGLLCSAVCRVYCHLKPDTCSYSASCPWNGGGHGMAHCDMGKGMDMGKGGMMGGQAPAEEKAK